MAQPVSKSIPAGTDRFYWGSRLQRVEIEGRGSRLVEVPLKRADLLDPREGDMMVHGPLHGLFIRTLADMLDRWFDAEDVAVFDDVKMLWGLLPTGQPDVDHRPLTHVPGDQRPPDPRLQLVLEVALERPRTVGGRRSAGSPRAAAA